jgi:hypothetical protein
MKRHLIAASLLWLALVASAAPAPRPKPMPWLGPLPITKVFTQIINPGGASSLSGMTAGQVPIAATATTVTSSKALAGSGAGISTGPTSSTNLDCAEFTGNGGQLADFGSPCGGSPLSGMSAGQVPIAATASTVTSSKALAGSGAGISTGPTSSTNLDCAEFTGTGGQLADFGFPCGGSSLPSASSNLKTAAPVQIPGTTVAYSPDPAPPCIAPGPGIVNCSPERDPVAGQMFAVYYDPTESVSGGCTSASPFTDPTNGAGKDSQGNTITTIRAAGLGYLTLSYVIPSSTAPDTFTPSAACSNGSGTDLQDMYFVQFFNASSVENSTNASADSCGSLTSPCTGSVTTTQPSELLFHAINMDQSNYSSPFNGYGKPTVSPQGVLMADSGGVGAYNFSASAAPTAGTYSVKSVNAGNATGWTRSTIWGIIPSTTSLVGTEVTATASGSSSVSSVSYGQTVTAGNTLVIGLYAYSFSSASTCTFSDTLGNSFSTGVSTSGGGGFVISHITVSGSDTTLTPSAACANSSSNGQVVVSAQLPGTWNIEAQSTQATGSVSFSVQYDNTLAMLLNSYSTSTTFTYTPGMDVIASNGTGLSYSWAIGAVSPPGPFAVTVGGNFIGNSQIAGTLYPAVQPVFPQQPRGTATTDVGAPARALQLPYAATETFDASIAHAWDNPLTGNVSTTYFVGGHEGQDYEFTFQNTTLSTLTVAQMTNVNVNNWPGRSGPIEIPAGKTQNFFATYDGNGNSLTFAGTPEQGLCLGTGAATLACGSYAAGYVTVAASATSVTVDTTAVGPNPIINLTNDDSSATAAQLGVTANTTPQLPVISSVVPGTSFAFTLPSAPTTNPNIFQYLIVNPLTKSSYALPVAGASFYGVVPQEQGTNTVALPTWHDQSGNQDNATSATGATFTTNAINTSLPALVFPGTTAGRYSLANSINCQSACTLFAVFKTPASGATGVFFSGPYGAITFAVTSAYHVYMDDSVHTITGTNTLSASTWYIIAWTYDNTTHDWALYENGTLDSSGTTSLSSLNQNETVFGYNAGPGSSDLVGSVAATAIYPGLAMTAANVTAVSTKLDTVFAVY